MFGFPIPLSWIVFAVTLLVTATYGGCQHLQVNHYKTKAEAAANELAQIHALGKAQEQKAQATITKQRETSAHVRKDYLSAVTELKRLRESGNRSLNLPSAPDLPQGANVAPVQLRPSCSLVTERAKDDALKLYFLQDFIRQQGFPVE